ncbi:MAG: hypothetical protein K2H34_11555 [Lachnospiraceae bacterium]|nr:hypothetical protein [Lachnospiraceae bacterium]
MMRGKGYIRVLVFAAVWLAVAALTGKNSYADEVKNGWSDGYFYIDGKKQTSSWVKDKNGKYYVNSSGKKVTGWKKIGGRYHYLNEASGGKIRNSNKETGVLLSTLSKDVITMGIDMSQWQGNVNWNKIKDSGVDFVMLRLGYGKGRYGSKNCTMDSKFKSYVKGAKEVGLPIGIYFYSYAKTPKQALAEAEYTIESLDGIDVAFPVAFDIEDAEILKGTSKAIRTEMVRTYMETVAAAGYTPMLYCNQNWYDNYLDKNVLKDYEFWYARYTYVEPNRREYNCGMWQATSTQKLSGITENTVDVNFLYKNYLKTVKLRNQALKYGWYKENGKWSYYYQGKRLKNGWFTMAGERYYIREGVATTGWRSISGEQYYFNKKGVMQTGFTKIGGKIYLFNDNGVQQFNTNEPGVTIREDGSCKIKKGWHKRSNGKYIYRYSSGGIAKQKWVTTKGKKYYCDGKGNRVTGFKTINGDRYYFDGKGVMKKGWLTYKEHKYYFQKNGKMVRNKTIKIKGKRYTFDKNGYLKK